MGIFLRGMAMGAADIVPGVSGGTIAFITGIYPRLIDSIKAFSPSLLTCFKEGGVAAVFKRIDAAFLLLLLAGIASSIALLVRVISYLLDQHPLLVAAFFFGLITASVIHMAKQIKQWRMGNVVALLFGAVIAVIIVSIKPSELPATPLWVFMAGAVAICAMILPGISGSFILLLMGMYSVVLTAVKQFDLVLIGAFLLGCGSGLLSFTHVLSWFLTHYYSLTLSLLTGFLVGSLWLIWPWKETLSSYTNSHGKLVPLEQVNISPASFEQLGQQSHWVLCLLLAVLGLVVVLGLEKVTEKKHF